MSVGEDRPDGHEIDGDRRVADALAAFGAQVRPDPGAWDRIDARLDARDGRRLLGAASTSGRSGRPLVAAAALVLVVLAGAIAVRARDADVAQVTADGQLGLTTADGPAEIAAVTDDGRLVGLGADGVERVTYYAPPADRVGAAGSLRGPITVDPGTRTVYAERMTAVMCGDQPGTYPVGEVVAIHLDGGEPEVVAPIGRVPAYDPVRGLLAYTFPTSRDGCSLGTDASSILVTDLATRAAAQIPLSSDRPSTDLSDWAIDIEWSVGDDQLLVLADQGRDLRRFAVGPSIGELREADRLPLWLDPPTDDGFGSSTATPGPGDAPVVVLLAESIEPVAPGPGDDADVEPVLVSSARHVQSWVDPDGATSVPNGGVQVVSQSIHPASPTDPQDVFRVASRPAVRIGPDTLGTGPVWRSQIDRDPTTGATLISVAAVLGDGVPDPPPADAMAIQFSATAVPSTSLLVLEDASGVRQIADGIVAAAWIPAERLTTEPPGTTTTAAPSPSLDPGTTSTELALSPERSPAGEEAAVGGSARPDDAAAIGEAFRAFFEHGDRSALEDSGVLEPAFEEGERSVPGGGQGVTVTLDAITFTGPEDAEVRFRLDKDGNFFTAPAIGSAVFVDGRWKVSAATMCMLLGRAQIPCPTTSSVPPPTVASR